MDRSRVHRALRVRACPAFACLEAELQAEILGRS